MGRREVLRDAMGGDSAAALALLPARICEVGVDRLGMQGVGVALITSSQSRSLLTSSGVLGGQVDELQFSLGEGPCLDAFNAGRPTLEPDLSDGGRGRWPVFAEAALDLGVHAVFAFPLQVGAARFGVLDLARTSPGHLEDDQLADALALADIATETVLLIQAESGLDDGAAQLVQRGSERIVVHQASGMVSAQAGIPIVDALARLRAYAFAQGLSLQDVASEVVARRLGFDS